MEKLISEQIVDSILSQDKEAFADAFNAAIAAKVSDALEVKKVEIASSLITPEMAVEEEAEQIDEANMRFDYEAAARPKSSDVKNFLNRNKNRRAAAATKKYIRRMTKLGGLGPNQTKKDTEAHMKAHFEEVEQVDEISTELISRARGIANKKAADADNRGHDVEREIHASQAGRFQKALDKRDRQAQLSRVSGAKARKYILSKEEVEQIDEDKNALTADHKKAITAHMVKRYGGSKEDVSFRYDPVTRTHSVEHESNETGMGYSHMINFKGRTATVEKHPYMTSDYYSEEVEQNK